MACTQYLALRLYNMSDSDTKILRAVTSNAQQSRHRLANQILDLIRDAKFEIGHHLREQQLGDMLGVSRTPVRAAHNLLAERGIVEAKKNQGFFLKAQHGALHRTELEVPATADQDLYARIVEDRLSGILGDSITQAELTRHYKHRPNTPATTMMACSHATAAAAGLKRHRLATRPLRPLENLVVKNISKRSLFEHVASGTPTQWCWCPESKSRDTRGLYDFNASF